MKSIKKFIKENKMFVITMCMLFFGNGILYWVIKLFQSNPTYINYYLDDKIPFWGWLIYVYDMFYPFCILAFYFLYKKDKKAYFKGIISGIVGFIISNIIFLIIPTIMYRPPIPSYDVFTNFVIKVTYFFDEPPLNCFPSIHCIFCFQVIFSYIVSKYDLKSKIWVITGATLIILSTLFVKQHYIYDVVSAFLVCIMANAIESLIGIYNILKKKKIL